MFFYFFVIFSRVKYLGKREKWHFRIFEVIFLALLFWFVLIYKNRVLLLFCKRNDFWFIYVYIFQSTFFHFLLSTATWNFSGKKKVFKLSWYAIKWWQNHGYISRHTIKSPKKCEFTIMVLPYIAKRVLLLRIVVPYFWIHAIDLVSKKLKNKYYTGNNVMMDFGKYIRYILAKVAISSHIEEKKRRGFSKGKLIR